MKVPDLKYYQLVVDTQKNPEILKGELQDLIQEISEFLEESKKAKGDERAACHCHPTTGSRWICGKCGGYRI